MNRANFIFAAIAGFSLNLFSKMKIDIFQSGKKGFKVNSGESRKGEHFKMKGVTLNLLDLKISSKDTNGEIGIFEQTGFTPNGGPPLHLHYFQDEIFYIVEGEYLFQVGDEKFNMKKGDTIFLPRNIQHAFIQLTEKAKVIVIYQPAGKMEEFFRITDSWKSPPSQELIKKTFEDCDMKVTGAPLKIN